jgi:single-strand DNA-binding protein
MSDIAVLTLTGRLTQDGELSYTNSDVPMLKFSVACNRWKSGGQHTSFYDCVMWGKIGEVKQRFANKGQHVSIAGYLDIDEFEGRNGKVRKPVVTVMNFEPTPGGGGSSGDPPLSNRQPQHASSSMNDDDDIPF